jgi:hypothetical protein
MRLTGEALGEPRTGLGNHRSAADGAGGVAADWDMYFAELGAGLVERRIWYQVLEKYGYGIVD